MTDIDRGDMDQSLCSITKSERSHLYARRRDLSLLRAHLRLEISLSQVGTARVSREMVTSTSTAANCKRRPCFDRPMDVNVVAAITRSSDAAVRIKIREYLYGARTDLLYHGKS